MPLVLDVDSQQGAAHCGHRPQNRAEPVGDRIGIDCDGGDRRSAGADPEQVESFPFQLLVLTRVAQHHIARLGRRARRSSTLPTELSNALMR